MTKIITITILTALMLISLSVVVLGNPYTLQAENGLIQPPTGLGFELTGNLSQTGSPANPGSSVKADVSYGAFTSLTITGELIKNFSDNSISDQLVKVYYSPVHGQNGYTFYLDYDLDKAEIPVYGVSLWLNTNLLLAYLNLQAMTGVQPGAMPLTLTPGASLKFGNLALGAEMLIQPNDFSSQDLRAGVSYLVMDNLYAKLVYDTGINHNSDQTVQLGLAMEI